MANDKKLVREITPMDEDFAQWYTDIVKKAEMIDYSSMRGCVIMRPYAQAIWENIQKIFDGMIKECGHENVAMPLFIPESLLNKEKDHVEGFAPEVAWVTHGGAERLEERLCVRPTSETLFCEHYAHIIQSWLVFYARLAFRRCYIFNRLCVLYASFFGFHIAFRHECSKLHSVVKYKLSFDFGFALPCGIGYLSDKHMEV